VRCARAIAWTGCVAWLVVTLSAAPRLHAAEPGTAASRVEAELRDITDHLYANLRQTNPSGWTMIYRSALRKVRVIERAHPDAKPPGWYESFLAGAAWRCADYAAAQLHIDTAGDKLKPIALTSFGGRAPLILGQTLANTPPWRQRTEDALQHINRRHFDLAFNAFKALAEQAAEQPRLNAYFREQMGLARLGRVFDAHEWVVIQPDTMLNGWLPLAGEWSVDDNGDLVGKPSQDGLMILHALTPGANFEMAGAIEFAPGAENQTTMAGPVFGYMTLRPFQTVTLNPADERVALSPNFEVTDDVERRTQVSFEGVNDFRIVVNGGKVDIYLNGQRILKQLVIQGFVLDPRAQLGLGAKASEKAPPIKFRNLRMRIFDTRKDVG
jgi:hypothetical protein